ncbi:MAG: hypothetical protein AAB513_01770 [Patescibacteria group bacterium]
MIIEGNQKGHRTIVTASKNMASNIEVRRSRKLNAVASVANGLVCALTGYSQVLA